MFPAAHQVSTSHLWVAKCLGRLRPSSALQSEPPFVFVVAKRNSILAATVLEGTADLWCKGGSRAIPPLRLQFGDLFWMLLWRPHTRSPGLLVLESWSQSAGLAIKRARGGGRFGGVTLTRRAQVVWLKRDSHLWCGRVEHGPYMCMCECVCVCASF